MNERAAVALVQKYEDQIRSKLVEVAASRGFTIPKGFVVDMEPILDEILSLMSEDAGLDLLIDRINDTVGMEEYGFEE